MKMNKNFMNVWKTSLQANLSTKRSQCKVTAAERYNNNVNPLWFIRWSDVK